MIIENSSLRDKIRVFPSRRKAGYLLGPFIGLEKFDLILVIPSGGLPVTLGLVEFPLVPRTRIELLNMISIRLPGFFDVDVGALAPDGQIYLNDTLINQLSVENSQLETQIERTKLRLEKTKREFAGIRSNIYGKSILLIKDGTASGSSCLAASNWLMRLGADTITLALPTGSLRALNLLEKHLSKIICLNIRTQYPYAIADAYTDWFDLSNEEVRRYYRLLQDFQPER